MIAVVIAGAPVAALVSLGAGASKTSREPPAQPLRVTLRGRELVRLDLRRFAREETSDRSALRRAVAAALPSRVTVRQGRGRVSYHVHRARTVRRALARAGTGGDVPAAASPFAARIPAPASRQLLRNNCETASLSILLATEGRRVPQLVLQERVRRSGPLDPVLRDGRMVWGDPELGYVGRASGGGVAGGFGVYEKPIVELARTYVRNVEDLSRRPAAVVYRRLLAGRAVMVWIGLSDGPYREWTSPAGRHVRANFGEHAVVLNGVHADGDLRVVNPLRGTRERWSRTAFELMWRRLGRRAIAA